ncbi:MAG: hypothetical protein M3361_17650 [Candidatus Tectomicrobia bacterium]|nr:hypothetical protein [Candidatus Tectomicrobia bacterium]
MPERHFLHISDDPARTHEIELTPEDIERMDLIPCGGFDSGAISETSWVFRGDPAGDPDYQRPAEPTDDAPYPF